MSPWSARAAVSFTVLPWTRLALQKSRISLFSPCPIAPPRSPPSIERGFRKPPCEPTALTTTFPWRGPITVCQNRQLHLPFLWFASRHTAHSIEACWAQADVSRRNPAPSCLLHTLLCKVKPQWIANRDFSLVSAPTISPSTDREMDRTASKARPAPPGLSIRNGPVVDPMDVDSTSNGTTKRKSRSSVGQAVTYKEESDSEDGAPLVGYPLLPLKTLRHWWADRCRPNAKNRSINNRNPIVMMNRLRRKTAQSCRLPSRARPPLNRRMTTNRWGRK